MSPRRNSGPMWRVPEANIDGASKAVEPGKTNVHLQNLLQQLRDELKLHRRKIGLQAIDNSKHSAAAPVPSLASLAIVGDASKGRFVLTITNPEFKNPKAVSSNPSKTPIYHQVEYANNAAFSGSTLLAASHQNNHTIIDDPGVKLYAKVKSSYDGLRFNQAQTVTSA